VPPIYGDRQKLRQVFLNLFINAADAMPGGGMLTVRIYPGLGPADGSRAVIEVTDTGHGIPADVLPRVMDPFFTTKGEGQGTGLGLAICRRIVHDHKGTIRIDSEPGRGTTVRIALPLGDGANVRGLS
jgi:signal transduction histidine kinase